jgi:hypothetical protein
VQPSKIMNISRWLILWLLISFLSAEAAPPSQQKVSQESAQSICVKLSIEKQRLSVGEALKVTVTLSNQTEEPIVIPNAISTVGGSAGHIEFKLTNEKGQISPGTRLIADSFLAQTVKNSWSSVLGRWLVLYPGYSLSANFTLDETQLKFISRPGKYTLYSTYSSGGLSYPSNYHQLGISEEDVNLSPYKSWSGKIQSNAINFTIASKGSPR